MNRGLMQGLRRGFAVPPEAMIPANPMPDRALYWLSLRHRKDGVTGQPANYADNPWAVIGQTALASGAGVTFSEQINGLLGARFAGNVKFTLNPAISLNNNTIIAVLRTPTVAEWGATSVCNICAGSSNGSPQIRVDNSGDGSFVIVNRRQQADIVSDSAYGLIPDGTSLCITVTVAANNNVVIRRNGVQTATGSGASFSQPLTWWGAKNTGELTPSPLLEFVLFDRVLDAAALVRAESYLMDVWGIS